MDKINDLKLENWVQKIKTRQQNGNTEVFDPVRRKYVILNPEEMVRQALLKFLMEEKKIPRSRMSVEKQFLVQGLKKRFDLLIFDDQAKPWMIVELKSFGVNIDQQTIDQAGWYNFKLQAPYLLISNGKQSIAFEANFQSGTTRMLTELPL
jgi:hypothetical protein